MLPYIFLRSRGGIKFDLLDVAKIFKTPYIVDLKPYGKYLAKDLYEIGGVPIIMKALLMEDISMRIVLQ